MKCLFVSHVNEMKACQQNYACWPVQCPCVIVTALGVFDARQWSQ